MISVCMASHNGEKFISKQIRSILEQLDNEDELIISDDGSTDNTLSIINGFKDDRIKLFHFQQPKIKEKDSLSFRYATKNFENSLKNANGDIIFLADQDDVWKNNKKKLMVEKLQQSELVMCNFSVIDENDKIINEKYYCKSPISKNLFMKIIESKYLGCCLAFQRKLLEKALPFPDNLIAHDFWLGCLANSFTFIQEPLHYYRRSNDNVSTSTGKSSNSLIYKIKYRVEFLLNLGKRLTKKEI